MVAFTAQLFVDERDLVALHATDDILNIGCQSCDHRFNQFTIDTHPHTNRYCCPNCGSLKIGKPQS